MAKQTFTSGQVLTAAEMNSLQENDYNWTVTTKTASYTLAAGDEGTRIVMNNAGATTITVDDAVFAAGDVVWIHNIGAGTCTITAGTATVTTIGNLALEQYAGGHLYFTSASAAIFFPTAQSLPGKILQVVQTVKTDTSSFAHNTLTTVLSVTITPSSATSKVLLMAHLTVSATTANMWAIFAGGNADDYVGDAAGSRPRQATQLLQVTPAAGGAQGVPIMYLDSPATTSATTYNVNLYVPSGGSETGYVNRTPDDTDNAFRGRFASSLTALEVSA